MRLLLTFSLFLLLLCTSCDSFTQDLGLLRQTVGIAGSSSATQIGDFSGLIQASVGQASVIGTFNDSKREIRQGFIQPLYKIVSGVQERPKPLRVTIFPNPFREYLTIRFDEAVETNVGLAVFDLSGRLLQSSEYDPVKELQIGLPRLSRGIYLLKINTDGRQRSIPVEKL